MASRTAFQTVRRWPFHPGWGVAIAAAVVAGVFVPGQSASAAPEAPVDESVPVDRGPDGLEAPDAASALTIARLQGERVEVIGERTETSSTWALPDGSLATGQASAPVWVRTGDGDGTAGVDWAPVDLTLQVREDGSISPASYPAELTLAGGGVPESGSLVTLAGGDGQSVSVAWTEELPEPRLEGPRAVYEDVQPGVDLVVEATRTGYEQFFVLTEAPQDPAALDLGLQVRTEGLETTADADGGVAFTDAAGELAGHSGTPLVWDAEVDAQRDHPVTEPYVAAPAVEGTLSSGLTAVPDFAPAPEPGEPSTTTVDAGAPVEFGPAPALPAAAEEALVEDIPEDAGQVASEEDADAGASPALPLPDAAVVVAEDTVEVALTPDASFLADPDTVYPVVVDPEVQFASVFDTFVQTGINSDQSGATELRIGTYNGGQTVARSFLNFDLGMLAGKQILNAQLYLYNFYSATCSPNAWNVFPTNPANTGTRINNQPGWGPIWATSSTTLGYSSSCGGSYVGVDLTAGVAQYAGPGVGVVGFGLQAAQESNSNGWKRFYSSEAAGGVPTLWVQYNTPPGPASAVTVSPSVNERGQRWTSSGTPRVSATANDADGGVVNMLFEVYRASDGQLLWGQWTNNVPAGGVGYVDIPSGILTEGVPVVVGVHTHDGQAWNTVHADTGALTWDKTAPAAPTVASTDYPNDTTWHGAENTAGAFTLTLPAADGSLSGYEWALDAVPSTRITASGNTTLTVTPPTSGPHMLQVRSVDVAGNRSAIVKYAFNVGRAGLVSPTAGAEVVRRVRLAAEAGPAANGAAFTHISFQWQRGPDSNEPYPIDLSTLTRADGSALTATWTPRSGLGDYAVWDALATLGNVPGPIQVRALLATDANGANSYATSWVTVTVDPNAAGAATDQVGPGTVNLLTGDYALSATDTDEFGLALGRTTSSRDPRSGYEAQAEMLTAEQRTMTTTAGWYGANATASRLPNWGHGDGTNSLVITPGDSGSDTFAYQSTLPELRRGSTFRVSGWIYVPYSTGLSPQLSSLGLRIDTLYLDAAGNYQHVTSAAPVKTDTWQYLSVDVTVPADARSGARIRLYNGFSAAGRTVWWDDISVREIWAPLGPQWSLGTADGAADTAYTHISQPSADVAVVHTSGGGEIWFTAGGDGKWWPQPGAESLTLSQTGIWAWQLRELDGTVSDFAGPPAGIVQPERTLRSGEQLASANGLYRLVMQANGDAVLYGPTGPTWHTNTTTPGSYLSMQGDGNIVVYSPNATALWASNTYDSPGARLIVQDDGNLVLYRTDNTPRWQTGTVGTAPVVPPDAKLVRTSPPAAAGQTRLVYENVNDRIRLTRLIAPVQPGVDNWPANTAACTTAVPAVGCQVQELVYATGTPATTTATSFGNYADRLVEVRLWSSVPGDTATSSVTVARYTYDDKGMLREVWDPRISPALKTAYTYDADGRVLTVTQPGLLPWRFTYGTGGARSTVGNGDLLDRSSGRLLSVTRASLQTGSATATGPDTTSTVVYNVPLNRNAGGPYDLNAAALATWAQTRGPTDGTAIFGPQDVPTVTTATPTTPGANGYKPATVHYLDASGREVNTASPAGPDAPVAGFIDTAEYDRFGHAVRTLDATSRLLALGQLTTASADLAALNLTAADPATRAVALSTINTYSADGLDLLRARGPLLRVSIGNDPNDVRLGHRVTTNLYDEGKPDGAAYHLVTTSVDALLVAGSSPEQLVDAQVTVNGYSPIDGASSTGPTSGWLLGVPTTVTADAGTGHANLTSRTRYDANRHVVETRAVGSTGSDATTVRTVYYTAGPNPDRSECGNNPSYAGLLCATYAAGTTTGADTTRMATALPTRTVTAYNRYGSTTSVADSATGPVNGTVVTQTRTTTTTYDIADRPTAVAVTGAGSAVGAAVARTLTSYDASTGLITTLSSVDASGTVLTRVEKAYDQLGRVIRYDDGAGAWTTTGYDAYNKPTSQATSIGTTTTYTYDRSTDPRGYLTSITDSVAGTMSASYGPDGQLVTQTLPGGILLTISYDANRTAIGRTYTRVADGIMIAASSIQTNARAQVVSQATPASNKTYKYDSLGRLIDVRDVTTGIGACASRRYEYNTHAGRTSMATATSASSTCVDLSSSGNAMVAQIAYTYDSGDRLVTSGSDSWTYDPLGRITNSPVSGTSGARVANSYYVNDLIQSQAIDGVARQTWTIDAAQRFSVARSETWSGSAWTQSAERINHYANDSDSPSWISENPAQPDDVTRLVSGVDGALAVQTGKTGGRMVQLIDLHGDLMGTIAVANGSAVATWASMQNYAADEFGNVTALTTGGRQASAGQVPTGRDRYKWLAARLRSGEALGGAILMGVRLYDPGTGRFWSIDPLPGGSSSAYDYANQDPVNRFDLDGRWPSWDSIWRTGATIAIGVVAAGAAAACVAATLGICGGAIGTYLVTAGIGAVSGAGAYAVSSGRHTGGGYAQAAAVGGLLGVGGTYLGRVAQRVMASLRFTGSVRQIVRRAVQNGRFWRL